MKKVLMLLFFAIIAMSGFAQNPHFSFSAVCESGQTLYFVIKDYSAQEVWVTYPCIGNSSYYYGYEKPVGDLVIPATVTHNDTVYTVTCIENSAFYECSGLTSVVFPNTLTIIGIRAFLSCHGLAGELVIPDAVTIIGSNAFFYCNNINSVVFGSNLSEIGDYSFTQCYSLEHISNFPETLTKIGDGAFKGLPIRDSIVIPPLVTKIGALAFAGCPIPSVVFSEGVTTIKRGAFSSCPIGAIHIPATLVSISPEDNVFEEGAFHNCTRLQSITVAEANPVYDSRGNCNALIETATNTLIKGCKNTVIPNDIAIIGPNAFLSINELNEITIPNTVERLETSAFAGCNSLTKIVLPSNITYIGSGALSCKGLSTIVSKSFTPPTTYNNYWEYGYDNSFGGVNQDIPIYIPFGTLDAYSNAPGWDYFNNFIESVVCLEGEWYYEILNDNSMITYQHLEYTADTTINDKDDVKIIVRTNQIYDKGIQSEVTHEYVYEENGVVYWWNKELQEFTVLYNFVADEGDEWEINVGTQRITMHVNAVESIEYEGRTYRMLHVSDEGDVFSGDIVCGIGHLTSFFPEKMMAKQKGCRVEGMRCFWLNGLLFFKYGDKDCDAVYETYHNTIEEPVFGTGLEIYPNPTTGLLTIRPSDFRLLSSDFRITNLLGQTMMTGTITGTIDVSALPNGLYFITIDNHTMKIVKQ